MEARYEKSGWRAVAPRNEYSLVPGDSVTIVLPEASVGAQVRLEILGVYGNQVSVRFMEPVSLSDSTAPEAKSNPGQNPPKGEESENTT